MIEVDSATGGVYEEVGKLIRDAGQEDASGSRRWFVGMLEHDNKDFCKRLNVSLEVFNKLRERLFLEDAA